MSAALGAATATSCARPHRAASGATAGPSRGPHPPQARHVRWSHGAPNALRGAMRRLLPRLPSRTAVTRASVTDDAPSSRGASADIPGDAAITRREALARTEASLARNDDWRDVLATVTHAAQLSGLPPARCVRGPRLWGHAGARWDLPAVLAMLRSLDGADFACCVRLVGEKGGARDALEVYKEGVKAGYDAGDGGASRAAMAWVHDARGQGKHADALWTELHAEAEAGRVDPGECARVAAGLNTWWKNNKSRATKQQRRRRPSEDATNDASSSSEKNNSNTQTMEVYALEIASKSRKRPRAAAEAYARLSEWHKRRMTKSQGRRSLITDVRVYTAACRAASALRDPRFARSVAVDVIAASPRCVIDDYMVASLAPVIGRDGSTRSADVVEALFDSARRSNGRSNAKVTDDDGDGDGDGDNTRRLGGAAWSCVIGALCRAGATGRASELLDEMADEPFMRRWPSCPTPGDAASTSTRSSIFDMSVDEDGDDKDGDEAAAAWAADAKHARSAAAQRRAAAPAYAQLMHVLLNSSARRGAQRALDVHKKMAAHGIAAPENPRHYRALYKAMLRGGGLGGRRMSPMQAAAASVADAVVASENLVGDVDVKARAAAAARASLHVAAVAGLPDVASRTLENLRGAGVAPVPEDLELTLEAFERAGDAAGAVALWEANRAALDQLNGSSSARGYNNDEREHMYDAMRVGLGGLGCEPTRRAWTAIVKAYCEAGEPIGAQRLLEESVESTRRKIGQDRRGVHKGGHKGGSSAARGASRRFPRGQSNGQRNGRHDGVELIAFNLVAAAFGRLGDPIRAERVLRGMLDDPHGDGVVPRPDRVTYNTVIDAYATNARPKRVSGDPSVSQPSRSQLNADDSNSHHDPDPDSDSPEFDPSSEEDPCDAAFRLLREMRSPKVRVEPCLKTWTSVLSACARSGDPHRAAEAFDRMRASGISPDTKAWTVLMQSHAARGDLGATAEVYWRMRTEGVAPNEGTLGAALAAGRVGGGDVSKLIAIYRDMRALDVRPNNRGFRQLTEMWVDQAFDDVDEHGGGDVRDGSDGGVTHARVHPNFMLADLLGPNVDGPAESIASRAVARSGDVSGNGSGEESGNMIDVHGLSVPETRAAVLSVLQALLERRRSGLGVHGNLVIVTGVGRSTPSEPPLRDAVVKLAGDLKLEIDIAPTNPGRLVAKEATLLTWLDRDRNETWSKERELVASVPTRKIRTGNRTDKTGGGRRGGNGGQRRYVGRRGRGAPRPTPTTGGLDSALRQWLDENSDESDSTTD